MTAEGIEVVAGNGMEAEQAALEAYNISLPEAMSGHSTTEAASQRYVDDEAVQQNEKAALREGTVCGIPRRLFFLIIGISLGFILSLALGLGLGLGFGLQALSQKSAAQSISSNSETAVLLSTTASSPTSTTQSSTITQQSSASSLTSDSSSSRSMISISVISSSSITTTNPLASSTPTRTCPVADGTILSASGHDFKIYCDSDVYAPNKTDLSSSYEASFDACKAQCASQAYLQKRSDISVVYNWKGTAQKTPGTCWCVGGTGVTDNAIVFPNPGNDLGLIQT